MAANSFNISNSPSLIHVFQFLRALPRFMFLSLLKEMTILIIFFLFKRLRSMDSHVLIEILCELHFSNLHPFYQIIQSVPASQRPD